MSFEIDKVAELARIRLKSAEKGKLEKDLSSILQYVEKLNSLNVDNVEPTSHVLNLENVFRPDEVRPWDGIQEVLKHAPDSQGKFFKVPKVVKR